MFFSPVYEDIRDVFLLKVYADLFGWVTMKKGVSCAFVGDFVWQAWKGRQNILYKTELQNNLYFCDEMKCLTPTTVFLVSCKPIRVGHLVSLMQK